MTDTKHAPLKVSEREMKALEVLDENCVAFYSHITTWTGLNLSQARRAVRSLARKGLAEHSVCWDEYDGMVRGSGYIRTNLGTKTVNISAKGGA